MAFNPSPEVAAARDYANKFDAEEVVIIYTLDTPTGKKLGYASYGKTKRLCDDARIAGDIAYDALMLAARKGKWLL